MEFFTALLSTLLALGSPVGYALDQVAADNFRSRLYRVEQLQVRIDNAPNYQIIQGRVDRLRLASRGAWLTPEVRLETLEVETDPIDLDFSRLSNIPANSSSTESVYNPQTLVPPGLLRTPLQAGVRLVVTEADIQKALESPRVKSLIQEIAKRFLGNEAETRQITPQIRFLEGDRFQLQVDISSPTQDNSTPNNQANNQSIKINLESGITAIDGSSFQLVNPVLQVNNSPLPSSIVTAISSSFLDSFNLKNLESRGIILRLLQIKITQGQVQAAAFVGLK
jgi:hypothetical protein